VKDYIENHDVHKNPAVRHEVYIRPSSQASSRPPCLYQGIES
jgi:hypothetical protein